MIFVVPLLLLLLRESFALNAVDCASSSSGFAVFNNGRAAPILTSSDDFAGVHIAVETFANDIKMVTGTTPSIKNISATASSSGTPIIVGTLGKSSLIEAVVKRTKLDVSSVRDHWEAFMATEVQNPLPGVKNAYVLIGADKRGTIYSLYTHSESFGVSPWFWWADVPVKTSKSLFASGCSHGTPTIKYRGIFFNDEQPALQNWAQEKFNKNFTSAPFNHFFYVKVFELFHRIRANYFWPAIWSSMFCIDDPVNQALADVYGLIYGTSHQEPMARGTPLEFDLFNPGQQWSFLTNEANITQFWKDGVARAADRGLETMYTLGIRGTGDEPNVEGENIALLEHTIDVQRTLLAEAYPNKSLADVPQVWALYKEVQDFYNDGMRVEDDVILLWTDDNWGNIRRFPIASERNRSGGAGVYYHVDYVGDPRDYKWIQSSQIPKIHEQMSLALERNARSLWILNVGDLKPYERDAEFFISLGYNSTLFNRTNLDTAFVKRWATREFGTEMNNDQINSVVDAVAKFTRWNALRKPELTNSTFMSLINYRESETWLQNWSTLAQSMQKLSDSLSPALQPAFFQLVNHPIQASNNLAQMNVAAGLSMLRASQARISANEAADQAVALFEKDFDFEQQYHTMLDGKWDHMMDQSHISYFYWQQPMTNSMPLISRVQSKKQALPGPMRIGLEGTLGAWPGDNPNDCAQQFSCPDPVMLPFDPFIAFGNRYIDVAAGGPATFSWTMSADQPWVKLSSSSGALGVAMNQTEQRVFVSIDWSKLPNGNGTSKIVVKATSQGQAPMSQNIGVTATKTSPPSDFHGFVEGDGVISIEAAHTSRNNEVNGMQWSELPGYGRTLSGMTPLPAIGNNDMNFTAGTGPSVEYDFFNFNVIPNNTLHVTTFVAPSYNGLGNDRPLGLAIQIDDGPPMSNYFLPISASSTTPAGWTGTDGFVANSIIQVHTSHSNITPGKHTLKVFMIEPAVVVEKLVIDTGGLRTSYLGPPESTRV